MIKAKSPKPSPEGVDYDLDAVRGVITIRSYNSKAEAVVWAADAVGRGWIVQWDVVWVHVDYVKHLEEKIKNLESDLFTAQGDVEYYRDRVDELTNDLYKLAQEGVQQL